MVRHLAAWVVVAAACGGTSAPPTIPHNEPPATGDAVATGAGPLLGAEVIEIEDVWVGLGCTHEFSARLAVRAQGFEGEATLAVGWGRDHPATRTVTVPRTRIATLQSVAAAARAQMVAAEPSDGRVSSWTDDYPSGSMTFTGPSGVYRLAFTDQQRKLQWEHDGKVEPLDRPHDIFENTSSDIWDAYTAVLDATGLRAWIDQACEHR